MKRNYSSDHVSKAPENISKSDSTQQKPLDLAKIKRPLTSMSSQTPETRLGQFLKENISSIFPSYETEASSKTQAVKKTRLGDGETESRSSTSLTDKMLNVSLISDNLRNEAIELSASISYEPTWIAWKDQRRPTIQAIYQKACLREEFNDIIERTNQELNPLQTQKQRLSTEIEMLQHDIKASIARQDLIYTNYSDSFDPTDQFFDFPLAQNVRGQYNKLSEDIEKIKEKQSSLMKILTKIQDQINECFKSKQDASSNCQLIDINIATYQDSLQKINEGDTTSTTINIIESAYKYPPTSHTFQARDILSDIYPDPLNSQLKNYFQKNDSWSTIFTNMYTLLTANLARALVTNTCSIYCKKMSS